MLPAVAFFAFLQAFFFWVSRRLSWSSTWLGNSLSFWNPQGCRRVFDRFMLSSRSFFLTILNFDGLEKKSLSSRSGLSRGFFTMPRFSVLDAGIRCLSGNVTDACAWVAKDMCVDVELYTFLGWKKSQQKMYPFLYNRGKGIFYWRSVVIHQSPCPSLNAFCHFSI